MPILKIIFKKLKKKYRFNTFQHEIHLKKYVIILIQNTTKLALNPPVLRLLINS